MVDLDLVAVDYHTQDSLLAFLSSYEAFKGDLHTTLTIALVEAHPGELDVIQTAVAAMPVDLDITIVPFSTNVGYARACNAVVSHVSAPTVMFLNSDTELRSGVLRTCHDLLWSDPSIGVVGPRQVDLSGRLTHAGIVGTNHRPQHRGWMEYDKGQFTDVIDCVTVSGAAYMVKREAWDQMANCPTYQESDPESEGAFLTCNHYWNETFLSYHLRHHGWRVVFSGLTTMIHRWHAASPQGGWGEQNIPHDQAFFRKACAHHGILCD